MNTRETFEAWARSAWGNQAYRHISATSGEWEAWQAGAAWAARECAEISIDSLEPHIAEKAIRARFPEAWK